MQISWSAAVAAALLPAAAFALPRGVAPMHVQTQSSDRALSVRANAAPPANALLNYYGGHVLANVHIVPVMWSANVPSAVSSGMPDFYAAITDSPYFDFLAEYDTDVVAYGGQQGTGQHIGRGTATAAVTINPSISSTKITDSQIGTELQAQIAAGHLPAPDANTLYMIHFPAGTSISMPDGQGGTASSCQQFCAYHSTIQASPQNIFYGVIPNVTTDGCELGCGPIGGGFNNTTAVSSHEMIEATTDAEVGLATVNGPPLAWYDPQGTNGEIGDICNGTDGTVVSHNKTWTVQQEWSNTNGACITGPQSNDFALNVSPGNLSIAAGSSATFTVYSVKTAGSPGTISLDASGLPAGITATFAANSLTPGASTTLTVAVSSSATNGDNVFAIHGTSGGTTRQAKTTATVTGGQAGGGGGGGNCPPGSIDVLGQCIATGCSSDGSPAAWLTLLGGVALLLVRRRSQQA